MKSQGIYGGIGFKGRFLKLTIGLAKGLKVYRTKGLTNETCKSFY